MFSELFGSLRRILVPILTAVGAGIALLAFSGRGTIQIPAVWLVLIGVMCAIGISVLFDLARRLCRCSNGALPSVRVARRPEGLYATAKAQLFLAPSPLFPYDAIVSVYHVDDDCEVLIGVGSVVNVQENGLVQVIVARTFAAEQLWEQIVASNASVLRQLRIKPNLPKRVLTEDLWYEPAAAQRKAAPQSGASAR